MPSSPLDRAREEKRTDCRAHLEADGQAVVSRRFVSKRASWPVDAVYDCGTWQPSDEPGSGLDSDDWRLDSWH